MKVKDLEIQLLKAENKIQFLQGQKSFIEKQIKDNENKIFQLENNDDIFLKASTLLQIVSEKTREHSISKIEAIVTQALREILENKSLRFRIVFENKRNTVSVEFKLWDDELNHEVDLRVDAGGLRGVVATILRLLVIDLYHPKINGVITLDEVGVQISKEYQPRFGKFLQQYSKLTGRQILLISHQDEVVSHADRVIKLKRIGTESKIVENGKRN